MKEIFYEESAKVSNPKSCTVKYNILKTMSIISYVFMGFWVFLFFNFFPVKDITFIGVLFSVIIPLLLFFFTGFLLGKFKNKMYVDYDYTFVSGSIRFSKVIKNTKRKNIFKFDCSDIEKLGKYGSESFEKAESTPGIKKMLLTSNTEAEEGKEFYYIVAMVEGEKKLLILECTELFIVNILKFASRNVLEEEFSRKQ